MVFLIILLYAILASTFTISKIALAYAKPFFLISFRMTLSGILLLGYLFFFRRNLLFINKKDIWFFFKVSLFHIYFTFIPEFWALQYISSSKTNLIYSLTPFIVALLSYFILKEKLSLKKFSGMIIGFLGLIPIFLTQTDMREVTMEFFSISLPEIVLLAAVFSAAYAWFIVRDLMNRGYSLLLINGFAMLIGGFLSFVTSFFTEGLSPSPIFDLWPFLGFVLLLILTANIIVYNLYAWLIKKHLITFVSSGGFLCPIFGAFYGYIFLKEHITWHYFLSLIFIAIGLYIFYNQEIKKKSRNHLNRF